MTQLGETEHFSDADHLRVINEHLGGKYIDVALINSLTVPYDYIEHNEVLDYLVQVRHDRQGLKESSAQIIAEDFLDLRKNGIYHDQNKLVAAIMRIYRHL